MKIKVLSSHHEDNFFCLRIEVWDPLEKSGFTPMHVITAPVKVISKPMRPKAPKDSKALSSSPQISTSSSNKRKVSDVNAMQEDEHESGNEVGAAGHVAEHLDMLQRQQAEAIRLLNVLLEGQRMGQVQQPFATFGALPNTPSAFGSNGFLANSGGFSEPPAKRLKTEQGSMGGQLAPPLDGGVSKDEFEGAFSTMLRAYAAMTAEEKAEKTRKLIRSFPHRDLELLEELFDILGTAGIHSSSGPNPFSFTANSVHNENCAEDCPHKEELMRIDQFYSEVFF